MKRKLLICLAAAIAVTQTGCVVSIRDAFSAGVFDFLSGSVTAILSSLIPIPGA